MNAYFTSLPNWLREFDSRRPLHTPSQVSGVEGVRFDPHTGGRCTHHCTHPNLVALSGRRFGSASLGASEADDAGLPEPEGERELVWRPGFGWVERPVEVPEPEVGREVAAAVMQWRSERGAA